MDSTVGLIVACFIAAIILAHKDSGEFKVNASFVFPSVNVHDIVPEETS